MFKMILSKAKNMLFENNGTSSSSNIFSFATKVGSIITGIGKWPLIFGGFIFAFLLTILIIVFAYPEDAAGELFNKTGTSDTCNEDPSSSSINAGSDARNKIIEAAKSQLGVPYVWGGESPGVGLDCSGLTQYAYSQAGIAIPHQSQLQKDTCLETGGKLVSLDEAKPGDIVWWPGIAGAEYGGSGHVAIYIGNNQIIEAPNLNGNVKVSELGSNNWLSSYGGILQWPI